ncbi:hypothetical protein [Candidatus Parabeggiatoa sp. HSG14]|uniref:hypothetical protein n=1 Tax=Candidatus Parabeggiatoa sp. HSG14 TaxID=3055593 RepID=UPI0025A70B2B|nr:hypothetical protein [Thiotrichales bacterium HSG14]
MDSPFFVAILVFVSIYLIFLLIRLFADFFLVAIALSSAVLAYNIQNFYEEILMILQESNLLNLLGLALPEQPDTWAIASIAGLIIVVAVLLSIPFLPFSATYRVMFGIENPVFQRKEAKVRGWIVEEIQRYHHQSEESVTTNEDNPQEKNEELKIHSNEK